MKKKFLPLLFLIFTLMGNQAALGATVAPMTNDSKIGGVVSPSAYETIYRCECQIIDIGNGIINISGVTSSYYPVEKLGLTLNLQQYSGGKWYTIARYSYSDYDSSYLYGGEKLGVSKGNYYRVFAQHSSIDGAISESGVSYTSDLYID